MKPMNMIKMMAVARRAAAVVLLAIPLATLAAEQKTFTTPEAAVDAYMAALKADDDAALIAIFGAEHRELIITPDTAANSATRAKFLAALQTFRVLAERSPERRVLLIGDQAWPFPVPLVKDKGAWRFATEEGVDEIINRRIGGNERNAIVVLRAYIDAQRQYASRDRDGDGVTSTRNASMHRAIATATACGSTRKSWAARPASAMACTGRPMPPRARR